MDCHVKEVNGNVATRQFKIIVPRYNEHGHYQQEKSMNAFINHWESITESSERSLCEYPDRCFLIKQGADAHLAFDFMVLNNSVGLITCMSVWEFYNHIKWDHKRKKLIA